MDSIASNATVVTVGGLYIVVSFVNLALSIWSKLRRNPPIDQTLQGYVRKEEFDRLRDEFDRKCDELRRTDGKIFDLLRDKADQDAAWKNGMSMQMGRFDSTLTEILKRINRQ